MKFYIGVTDDAWFEFLRARNPEELNFWRPGGSTQFRAIPPGSPFLFKLHSPNNFVVGGGYFLRHSNLPLSLAWEAFGEKNGASSFSLLLSKINRLRGKPDPDPTVGCTILVEPFFLDRADWIPIPRDWSSNIVQGKTYDTGELEGARVWTAVRDRLNERSPLAGSGAEEWPGYGATYAAKARLGQGAFRVAVTEAYGRRCTVTGERTLPVLEAAHIKPYAKEGPHAISNGLLLRSDLHILFDKGYVTVTPELEFEVSRSIKDRFHNGREYYKMNGQRLLVLPSDTCEQPAEAFLNWHNENVFLAG